MGITHLTNDNFSEEVTTYKGLVVIDFWATWCGPCAMLSPIIEAIAAERDDVKICKVDVDQNMALAQQFHIASIPAILFIKDGEFVYQMIGFHEKGEILSAIDAHL